MKIKLFALGIAALFIASCSKDDDGGSIDKDMLQKKWYNESTIVNGITIPYDDHEVCGKDYWEFRSNGVLRVVDVWNCEEDVEEATWSVSGKKLTISFDGESDSATIKKLTEETLILNVKYDIDDDGDDDNVQEVYTSIP